MRYYILLLAIAIPFSLLAQKTTYLEVYMSKKFPGSNYANREWRYVMYDSVNVNSISNVSWKGGKNKKAIEIKLPDQTEFWYYRITILDINSKYKYPDNETFYYNLVNEKSNGEPSSYDYPINVIIMNNSLDAFNFETNKGYKRFTKESVYKTKSYIGKVTLSDKNIWIWIENFNDTQGLKVIIEVIAVINTNIRSSNNITNIINADANEKKLKEAKELYDLGVYSKKAYDSIFAIYSIRLSREEAISQLKEAKIKLDAGKISSKDYEEIKNRLSPFILNPN